MTTMKKRIRRRTWRLLTPRVCPTCGQRIGGGPVLRAGRWYCSAGCALAA